MRSLVAPYTGAWIETEVLGQPIFGRQLSLPTRERGLKRAFLMSEENWACVAPYTGAWIETRLGPRAVAHEWRRSLHGSVD